jgi:hypothetical protein
VDLARATGVPVPVSVAVEQIYRQARARYGDTGGEMLPVKPLEDLTGTPLRLPAHHQDALASLSVTPGLAAPRE